MLESDPRIDVGARGALRVRASSRHKFVNATAVKDEAAYFVRFLG
jgi:hypothetical protein